MRKRILICVLLMMLLTACTPSAPNVQQCTAEASPTETAGGAAGFAESYLIEDTESKLISIQVPCDEALSAENTKFIRQEIRNAIADLSDSGFDLHLSTTDIADKNRDYTECYLVLSSQIQYLSEDWVSITMSGLYNNKAAAHPLNVFFTINFDPESNTKIMFSDRYTVDDSLYEKFAQEGECIILERNVGVWPEGWGDFAEAVCSKTKFVDGLKAGTVSFYRTADEIGFYWEMPVAFGEPLVVTVPD